MVEDKYIGIALAVSGTVAIGTSFILTKKGLNHANDRSAYAQASDNYSYFKSPIWWAGMTTMILGEVANFAAYTFAPPILVTPLGALSVIIGAILASFLLNESLGHIGRIGCTLCLLGALIIILHAPPDKDIQTVDEILVYAVQPGFLLYCFTVLVFTLFMIYKVVPRYGRTNPSVYISICSLVGSISIMAVKGFGIAVKLTFAGNNQFTHPSTYVFGIFVALCIVVQMNYFNKALDTFSTNVVNPLYFVGFSTATIVASVILFQGFNTDDPASAVSLLAGFAVTFLGVHLLEVSRSPDQSHLPNGHSALEGGLMNPRLSISGRMSVDGWNGAGGTPIGGGPFRIDSAPSPHSPGHVRRGSGYRVQTLFNALDSDPSAMDSVGLERLPAVEEGSDSDDDDNVNERTHLHGGKRRDGARSSSHSPQGSQGDPRRSPH